MKTHLFAAAAGLIALAPLASAQETVVTTTQPITPGSSLIIVTTASGPMTYNYTKTTTFVDAAGNPVTYETIKAGEPTTVYYTTMNGQPVVSRVVVNRTVAAPVTKTETTETTTTTTTKKK